MSSPMPPMEASFPNRFGSYIPLVFLVPTMLYRVLLDDSQQSENVQLAIAICGIAVAGVLLWYVMTKRYPIHLYADRITVGKTEFKSKALSGIEYDRYGKKITLHHNRPYNNGVLYFKHVTDFEEIIHVFEQWARQAGLHISGYPTDKFKKNKSI